MTNEEVVCRKYCELRGFDPDDHVTIPCPDGKIGCTVAHLGPRWKLYREDVRHIGAIVAALRACGAPL